MKVLEVGKPCTRSTFFAIFHFTWNRANHCGGTCSQLMSQIGGGKTGNRLRWSIHFSGRPTIRLPGFDLHRRQWSLLNRFRTGQGHCNACHNALPTTNYVTVEKSRQCHTSSTFVHWPSLTAVYCAYMKQMRLPSTGWQHMALSTR